MKIHNAALKNAVAVVVINNNPEGLLTMSLGGSAYCELAYSCEFFITSSKKTNTKNNYNIFRLE